MAVAFESQTASEYNGFRMNCAELRSDIDRLKDELQALGENVETTRGAEGHSKEFQDVAKSIDSNSSDSMLKKYLDDFREQNPEFFSAITLGERIDIEDAEGRLICVTSVAADKNGRVLIGGEHGTLYAGSYGEYGELVLGERIDIKDANEGRELAMITSITIDESGHVLIGGGWGVFYEGYYDDQGKLMLGERIDVRDVDGDPAYIKAITVVNDDDGRVLIGGTKGAFYEGSCNNHGEFALGKRIDIKDAFGCPGYIQAIAATGDGHILIGVHDGMVYDGFYDERGELRLSGREEIDKYMSVWAIAATDDGRVLIGGEDPEGGGALYVGSYDARGELTLRKQTVVVGDGEKLATIFTIAATDGGRVLIGTADGTLYAGLFTDQGELVLNGRESLKSANGKSSDVFSITVIDGERALIGGRDGALYAGSFDTSLEALKRHLPEIVAKGEPY